jgi:hypothetical protein
MRTSCGARTSPVIPWGAPRASSDAGRSSCRERRLGKVGRLAQALHQHIVWGGEWLCLLGFPRGLPGFSFEHIVAKRRGCEPVSVYLRTGDSLTRS